MRKLVLFVAIAGLCFLSPARRPVLSQPAAQGSQLSFSDIVGTVGMIPSPELVKQMKVGFERIVVAFSEISPSKGTYNWQKVDSSVQQARSQGMGVVLDLAYMANWASIKPNLPNSQWQFYAPKNVSDWTDFVDAAVTHYMASPYDVKYFQVWNEPHNASGFWQGATDLQWVDMIYIPAGKLIRKHGAYVVFGGWPSGSGIPAYNAELQYHNAWQYTDILDVHYYPVLANWPALYNQWIATGKCKGIWETEFGASDNPQLVTAVYTNTYNWARTKGHWSFPDQYKVFWYPGFGATDNAALTKAVNGKAVLTANGQALAKVAAQLQ